MYNIFCKNPTSCRPFYSIEFPGMFGPFDPMNENMMSKNLSFRETNHEFPQEEFMGIKQEENYFVKKENYDLRISEIQKEYHIFIRF